VTYSELDLGTFDSTLPSFGIESSLFDGETIGMIEGFNDWNSSLKPSHLWESGDLPTEDFPNPDVTWNTPVVEAPRRRLLL